MAVAERLTVMKREEVRLGASEGRAAPFEDFCNGHTKEKKGSRDYV
jgi:hypothetical protein